MDRINLDTEPIFDLDAYTMIRGYPRKSDKVKFVESQLGGKLLNDKEAGLMSKLDEYLFRARLNTGKYPDYLSLPSEPFNLYVPIPFEIYYLGLTFNAWHKPAWFVIKRQTVVPGLPWKNA